MNAYELYRSAIRLNTTDPKDSRRNAYIEMVDGKRGSTEKTFTKNLFNSLVALGTTKTYTDLEEDPLGKIFYNGHFPIDLVDYYLDDSTVMTRNHAVLSSSKKIKLNQIIQIIDLKNMELKSHSLIFLLFFMTSLPNLNNLTADFQKIYLKPSPEIWEKTGYIHQPISEIYREEFLFALLLEFLNIASFGWEVCTVPSINTTDPDVEKFQKIYNSYLEYYTDRFHKYYENKSEDDSIKEPEYIPLYRTDQKVVKPFVFNKTVKGKLQYPEWKNKHKKYKTYTFPKEITDLSKNDSEQTFSFVLELFILSVNPDLIKKVTTDMSFYGSPSSIRKYSRESLDRIIANNNENIKDDYIPEVELDVYIEQQNRTLRNKSSNSENQSELIHYYINPKVQELVDTFTTKLNVRLEPDYQFIRINL